MLLWCWNPKFFIFSMAGSSASEVIFLSVSHSITLMGEFVDVLNVWIIN